VGVANSELGAKSVAAQIEQVPRPRGALMPVATTASIGSKEHFHYTIR
jgi:hypothetical protein